MYVFYTTYVHPPTLVPPKLHPSIVIIIVSFKSTRCMGNCICVSFSYPSNMSADEGEKGNYVKLPEYLNFVPTSLNLALADEKEKGE